MERKEIEKIIKELDPKLKHTSDTFKRATILLSSAFVGPNIKKISEMLELPENDNMLLEVEKNARKSGIWKGDKIHCEWMDKEEGGISFWLDVCVVEGLMERTK